MLPDVSELLGHEKWLQWAVQFVASVRSDGSADWSQRAQQMGSFVQISHVVFCPIRLGRPDL